MKILHVVSTLDPSAGGPPRVALSLAAGATVLGHRVTFMYYDAPAARDRIEQQLDEVPGARGMQMRRLPAPSKVERIFARGARREILAALADVDIVHLHSVWDPISMTAMRAARRRGVPYVLLANGMLDPWSLSQRWLKKRIALFLGVRQLLNRAAFLQALNTGERDCIALLDLRSPIRIITNGIDATHFDPLLPRGEFYAAHPELNGKPYILFLGRLHFKKGLDYLVESFASLSQSRPDIRLVVAGPDDGAQLDFERDVRARGLQDRVHRVGSLYGNAKLAALRDAECFCLPSRQEGFSVAVLEAMACATPVVISTACHFPEVAQRGAGEVVELDSRQITSALARVIDDRQKRNQMGEAARAFVFEQFKWSDIARQMVEAYQNVIDAPKTTN